MQELFRKLTNSIGTITAILAAILAFMTQVMGCTAVDGAITGTCTASWIPASYVAIASGVFGILSLIAKSFRPGGLAHSWFGTTAVVVAPTSPASGPGTVTPAEVKAP
jgi:hypothetical protein